MGNLLGRIFLYPGNRVCDAIHVKAGDDRMMLRSLINMLVWNLAIVLVAVAIY